MDIRCLPISFWLVLAISDSGTGADPRPVIGTVGQRALLSSGLQVKASNLEIVWEHISSHTRILEYMNGKTETYNTSFIERVKFHRNDFSLEIFTLRTQDTGVYEVTVTQDTGAQTASTVRLEVYEQVLGTQISFQRNGTCNFTLTCSVASGDPASFRWWKGGEALGNDSTHHLRGHGETVEVHPTAEVRDVVYKCEARNPGSTGTAQIHLKDVCKQTTSATGLPWWRILIMIVIIIAILIIIIIIIRCCCRLRAMQLTRADLCAYWANWYREEPDQRASFCTLLLKPETIMNTYNITDEQQQLDVVKVSEERLAVCSSQAPPDRETPAHSHPLS